MSPVGEFGTVGVQVLGGRIEVGRTVEHRGIDEPTLASRIATRVDQSGFGLLRGGRFVVRRAHAFAVTQDVLPQPQLDRENTAGRRVGARSVNNKIQKRAVNPLTRHASRSVMGSNYQSPQVEGPAGDI